MAMNAFYLENLHEKIKVGVARAKAEGKYKGRKKGSKNKN
jgi:DNA invertase Pin-like site-specific DNA recombinase